MKILYLGLRPKEGTFHYPVIRTELCPYQLPSDWPLFTHMIFTSQTAVEYWSYPWDKEIIAIGQATALALQKKGISSQIAPFATQEGVIELIRPLAGYFFIPRSNLARSALTDYLKKEGKSFYVLDLYCTVFQKLEPIPNLKDFDEIVFTSPSTVEGFLRIYGSLPQDKKLTAIGPITEQALFCRMTEKREERYI
jgi:uroporphyrinogen-III synthase